MEKHSYTADRLSSEEAFAKADIVITGEITKLGMAEPEGMGQVYYSNTGVNIQNLEKGNLHGNTCVLVYQVVSFKGMHTVDTPAEGNSYRFYITVREGGKTLKAFKITDI